MWPPGGDLRAEPPRPTSPPPGARATDGSLSGGRRKKRPEIRPRPMRRKEIGPQVAQPREAPRNGVDAEVVERDATGELAPGDGSGDGGTGRRTDGVDRGQRAP